MEQLRVCALLNVDDYSAHKFRIRELRSLGRYDSYIEGEDYATSLSSFGKATEKIYFSDFIFSKKYF